MKKYKLPKEFAEKWVSALRSGEYKQIKGIFFDEITECYCATGVAYISNGFTFKNGWLVKDGIRKPASAWEQIGKVALNNTLINEIIYLNDDMSMPFNRIADWIEENVNFV